jgi:hypothetical protein
MNMLTKLEEIKACLINGNDDALDRAIVVCDELLALRGTGGEVVTDQAVCICGKAEPHSHEELRELFGVGRSVGGEAVAWHDGFPPHPYDKEWFIAVTKHRDRVVLTALPEEFTYDFKTADETYIKKEEIVKWMQFPDSEFIRYTAPAASSHGDLAKRLLEYAWSACDDECEGRCQVCPSDLMREAAAALGGGK